MGKSRAPEERKLAVARVHFRSSRVVHCELFSTASCFSVQRNVPARETQLRLRTEGVPCLPLAVGHFVILRNVSFGHPISGAWGSSDVPKVRAARRPHGAPFASRQPRVARVCAAGAVSVVRRCAGAGRAADVPRRKRGASSAQCDVGSFTGTFCFVGAMCVPRARRWCSCGGGAAVCFRVEWIKDRPCRDGPGVVTGYAIGFYAPHEPSSPLGLLGPHWWGFGFYEFLGPHVFASDELLEEFY